MALWRQSLTWASELRSEIHRQFRSAHEGHRPHAGLDPSRASTGVVWCTERANEHGFADQKSSWANLGQVRRAQLILRCGFDSCLALVMVQWYIDLLIFRGLPRPTTTLRAASSGQSLSTSLSKLGSMAQQLASSLSELL